MLVELRTTIKQKPQVFQCECPLFIRNGSNMSLIELAGATTAVKAVWAHLVKRRTGGESEKTDIYISLPGGEERVSIIAGTKFQSYIKQGHQVIMDVAWSDKQRKFILGGDLDTPPIHFLDTFRINLADIPILPRWQTILWRKGMENNLVRPLTTFGSVLAWKLDDPTYGTTWEDLVKELVLDGTLSCN